MARTIARSILKDIHETLIRFQRTGIFIDIKYLKLKGYKISSFKDPIFIKKKKDYIEKFISINGKKEYVIKFNDGGIITLYYEFEGNENDLRKASLTYYPCPYQKQNTSENEFIDINYQEPILKEEEDYLFNYLRIDYNTKDSTEIYHPVTHIHWGLFSSARIACDRLHFFSDFVEFILFLYYNKDWKEIYLNEKICITDHIKRRVQDMNKISYDGSLTPLEAKYRFLKI